MATVELVGRLLIALAVVLGVIWLIAKKARSGAGQKLRSDKLIDILGRQSLTRGSSVAVIRIADQALIVGVTDSNVRVLGEVELDAVAAHIAAASPTTKLTVTKSPADETAEYDAVLARRRVTPDTSSGLRQATGGKLSGSALSPAMWKQTIDALRDMTARKG